MIFWLFLALFQDPVGEGMKALDQRNYTAAIEAFTKAAQADPADYAARFHLGLAYSLKGDTAAAIPHFKAALERKSGLYEAQLNLGIALLDQKQATDAIPLLQAAAAQKPGEFRPRYYLGEAQFASGDMAAAEASYAAALERDPKSADAELGLARTLARLNRLDEAERHYTRAGERNPDYTDGPLELASVYEAAKQPERAIAIYEKFADRVAVQERLGVLLLEKRPLEAIPHLEKAAAASPSAANRLALAQAYRETKQPAKAIEQLDLAVKSEPRDAALRLLYGRILRDGRNFQGAANQFYAATQIRADSSEAWSEFAGALILLEDYPRALAALDKVRQLQAETAAHFFFRALALDHLNQFQPAYDSYRKFLELSEGKSPNEEFKARQRARILEKELKKR
ncbi:MAG: tetratricopeptide repeat protein [Bryobacteraceae bacterium]|nr:tetratricopeptide repeat protein [Bryobacteraceae bacterium]